MKTFEEFWNTNYKGKLGNITIENAFKEVAQKAYLSGFEAHLHIERGSEIEYTEKQKTLELTQYNLQEWKQEAMFLVKLAFNLTENPDPYTDEEWIENHEGDTPYDYLCNEVSCLQ